MGDRGVWAYGYRSPRPRLPKPKPKPTTHTHGESDHDAENTVDGISNGTRTVGGPRIGRGMYTSTSAGTKSKYGGAPSLGGGG